MRQLVLLILVLVLFSCNRNTNQGDVVNVYTHRHYESDQEIFRLFEAQTGIKVNVINASADELIQKMNLEGKHSPADVLITVDAGRLHRAKESNLLQPIQSNVLDSIVAPHLKDSDNQWTALTKRARVIVYAPERVEVAQLSDYENLINDNWKGRVLSRSSSNIYNQSLLASIIAHHGNEKASNWVKGMVSNFARPPRGNDRDQIKSVAAAEGDLALVNTYYLGLMLHSSNPEEVRVMNEIEVFFPNQNTTGTHINVSGIGLAKYAPNKENAIKLIEFLLQEQAQGIFAHSNYEYPVNYNVEWPETLKNFGEFKEDTLSLHYLGVYNRDAVILFDEGGWR